MRNGVKVDTLNSVYIEEIVNVGESLLEICEKFVCHNFHFNRYAESNDDLVEKRN